MNCIIVAYLAAACMLLQTLPSQAKLTDSVKGVTQELVEKAADKADQVAKVPQTGGVRQTILHHAVDMAMEHGMAAAAKKYPALEAVVPLAKKLSKSLSNKAHEKINNLNTKKTEDSDEETATTAPDASKKDEEKEGLMGKLSSLIKGKSADEKKSEDVSEAPKEVEQSKDGTAETAKAEKKSSVKAEEKEANKEVEQPTNVDDTNKGEDKDFKDERTREDVAPKEMANKEIDESSEKKNETAQADKGEETDKKKDKKKMSKEAGKKEK